MNQKKLALLPILLSALSTHVFWAVSPSKKMMHETTHTKHAVAHQAADVERPRPVRAMKERYAGYKQNRHTAARKGHGSAKKAAMHHANGEYDGPKHFLLEANFGLFRPSSCILREIYGKNWINYQVKASGSIVPHSDYWRKLHAWFAINYAANSGLSINGLEYTKMQIVPLTFGLQFIQPGNSQCGNAEFHLGLGLRYYFVDIKNKSEFVDPCVEKSTLGGVIEAGVYFLPTEHIAFNLGLDYGFGNDRCSKKRSSIPNVKHFDLKLSGLTIGGGIGFRF